MIVGCAVFGSDEPTNQAAKPPQNEDAGGGIPPVSGIPDTSVKLSAVGEVFYVVQGGSAKLSIKVTRGDSALSAIDISVTGLPAGVTAGALTIPAGSDTGEIVLTGLAAARQGPSKAVVRATSVGSADATPLNVFVRGTAASLDTTFGTAGQVSKVFGAAAAAAPVEVIRLPDDRLVIVGVCGSSACALRLAADGNVDLTFGTGGRTTFAAAAGFPAAAALAPDGSIVVTFGTGDTRLFRIRADGTLDPAFGDADLGLGTLTIPARSGAVVSGVAVPTVASDGSIFVAYADTEQFEQVGNVTVAKLTKTGSLDGSFGAGGQIAINFGTPIASPIGLTVRANGAVFGVVQARASSTNSNSGIFGFQLTKSGGPDSSIGQNGRSQRYGGSALPFPPTGLVAVAQHPDGRMISAYNVGSTPFGAGVKITSSAILTLGSDAKTDTGFGTGGSVVISGGAISDVDRTPDGRVLVVRNPHLLRFTQAGAPDTTFGGGMIGATFGANVATFKRAAIQQDGRIVVVGTWKDEATGESDVLVSRYWQ